MGNNFSTGLGGCSKVFPVGTFVRIKKKLTLQEMKEGNENLHSAKWLSVMNDLVGKIGIVLGGSPDTEENYSSVAFQVANGSTLGDWWNFQDIWLESVDNSQVGDKLREWLHDYMFSELRKLLLHTFEKTNFVESKFGPAGTLVQVCSTPPNTDGWNSMCMNLTLNRIGFVLGELSGATCVVFPEPICYVYYYENSWLSVCHTQSLDDLTLFPQQYESLKKLYQIVTDISKQEKKWLSGYDSDDSDEEKNISNTREFIFKNHPVLERIETLEKRISVLEKCSCTCRLIEKKE